MVNNFDLNLLLISLKFEPSPPTARGGWLRQSYKTRMTPQPRPLALLLRYVAETLEPQLPVPSRVVVPLLGAQLVLRGGVGVLLVLRGRTPRLVPVLHLPGPQRNEDHVGGDEHRHGDPEHDAPLLHGAVGDEHADEVGGDDAGQRADGVHQGHDGARVVGRQVQGVDARPGVVRPHGGHTQREEGDHEVAVAARVRRPDDAGRRAEGRDGGEQLPGVGDGHAVGLDEPVRQTAEEE